jgi:hypothetical protein
VIDLELDYRDTRRGVAQRAELEDFSGDLN